MTNIKDLMTRRKSEQRRIKILLDARRSEDQAKLKGGEDAVAWVKEEQCIGCDQCTIVCDDDAIELDWQVGYRTALWHHHHRQSYIDRTRCIALP